MSYDKMDSSAVYAMFEEIKEDLNKRPAQQSAPDQTTIEPAIRREDMAEMQEMTAILKEVVEAVRLPQKHIHKHTIDLMLNKVLIVLATVMVALVVSLWVVRTQRDCIKIIRQRVEHYEQLIQEQAKSEAKAKLNAEEAERLKQEMEQLKK